MDREPLSNLERKNDFVRRHVGPGAEEQADMLAAAVAAKRSGITDFAAAIKTGALALVFELAKIEPGFIRGAGDQIDKPVFNQLQVEIEPILDFFALLVQRVVGFGDVVA